MLTSLLVATGLGACSGPTALEVQVDHEDAALAAQQEIESALVPLDTVGEHMGTAVRDSCETGQHNWKIDDPYDVRCTIAVHTAYRVSGEDFRTAADQVTNAFPDCPDSDAEATLRDYWDKLKGTQTRNFEQPYRPDYLPSYRLDCDQSGTNRGQGEATPSARITVEGWATLPADAETLQRREHEMGQPCDSVREESPCEWDGVAAQTILEGDDADEGWIVFVSGSRVYATTP